MTTAEGCEIFLKITRPVLRAEEILRNKKYLDGIAFDKENSDLIDESIDVIKEVFVGGCKVLIVGLENALKEILKKICVDENHVLLAFDEFEKLKAFRRVRGNLKGVSVGIHLTKPVISLTQYTRLGVEFVLLPPALVRGRLITEAKARKVSVIAYQVNDVATYVRLVESGVNGIVTTVPTIKREAKKLVKT